MNHYYNEPIAFPKKQPFGYEYQVEPITFDVDKHLALKAPETILTLDDLGYSAEEIAQCSTNFAVSSAARLLSDEGVEALLQVARSLRQYAVGCERIDNLVRGGVYQSKFLRDLCLCPQVTEFLSGIYGIPVSPHSLPLQLGHFNFSPDDYSKSVDKWHHDTLELDYVLSVSDPASIDGGEFQYFMGTKQQASEYASRGESFPASKIISPEFPKAGYMVILHGNMVVHRAAKLNAVGERITMVNGYVPLQTDAIDYNRFNDLKVIDPHHLLFTEWARHKAWIAQGKLERLIDELEFTDDRQLIINQLKQAVVDVETAINDLSDDAEVTMIHYGG